MEFSYEVDNQSLKLKDTETVTASQNEPWKHLQHDVICMCLQITDPRQSLMFT